MSFEFPEILSSMIPAAARHHYFHPFSPSLQPSFELSITAVEISIFTELLWNFGTSWSMQALF